MLGIVQVEQHKIMCTIGVLPHEKIQKQEIFVDIKIKVDLTRCVKTDNLDDAINYLVLAETCTKIAQNKHYHLIETLAHDLLISIIETSPAILWAWVKVSKPQALLTALAASVQVESDRNTFTIK